MGRPSVQYNISGVPQFFTAKVGYVVYLDLIQLNPGLGSTSSHQSGRNGIVRLGSAYKLWFLQFKFLDASAAGPGSWNPAIWVLKLP
jgi:hypothetical protein